MANTVKTAIAIPREDYELVEAIRKETGKSRSQILVEAFQEWVSRRRKEKLESHYEAAYRKHPERLDELKTTLKASAAVWGKDTW
ncbi:MAG: ribbon-helix-helix protein, CopG family [Ignavibacteriae bacterium]|nr:ribbon-helix-helix protein, CopG family [Ignavibacteriota bacterium]